MGPIIKKKINWKKFTDHSDAEIDSQGFKITMVNVLKCLQGNGWRDK